MLPQHLLKLVHDSRRDTHEKLEHARRSMRVHTESDCVTGIHSAAELIVQLTAELETWDTVLTSLENRSLCDLEADIALTYQTLRTRAADHFARTSFRHVTSAAYYEQQAAFVVAQKLQMLSYKTGSTQAIEDAARRTA